ncbi:MAG: UBP-type zinc finger domain-containing protein [Ornithinimicrobium sp.]
MATCQHLDHIDNGRLPSSDGCQLCLAIGGTWIHLRMCSTCGHVGCCDSSPNRHASAHNHKTDHPLIRSFEPREEWYFCYPDSLVFELDNAPPAPSHH